MNKTTYTTHLYTQTWDQTISKTKKERKKETEPLCSWNYAQKVPFAQKVFRTNSCALLLVGDAVRATFGECCRKLVLIACNFSRRLARLEEMVGPKIWLYWLIWVLPASPLRNTGRTILKKKDEINCYYNVVNIITRI